MRLGRWASLGLAALTAAGCGTAATSHSVSASPYPRPQSRDVEQIQRVWQAALDGTTPAQRLTDVVERARGLEPALTRAAASDAWRSLHATVDHVVLADADHAIVTFTLYRGEARVISNQSGLAVRRDGVWRVSASAMCAVLTLESTHSCRGKRT